MQSKAENVMAPYQLTTNLDEHFQKTDSGGFQHNEFINIVETLQATGCVKNQMHTFELFKTLPKEEVIRRANIVSRLNQLLKVIKSRRYVIPGSST
jgi:hypothetical protein